MDQRIREVIIAIGAMALLAAAVAVWRQQFDVDLPPLPQAGPIRQTSEPQSQPSASAPSSSAAPHRAAPSSNPGGWLSDSEYPAEALRNGWQGTSGFRLTISAVGDVEHCVITASSGHAVLDEATCRLLSERARFQPARNESGMAMADTYNGRITWRIPS